MSGEEDEIEELEEVGDREVSPALPVVSIGSHSGSRSPDHDDGYSDITL